MFFTELETDRLFLKNIGYDDRDFMLKQFSNDIVNKYLFDEEPMTCLQDADELIDFYTQPEPRNQHRWILVLKSSGEKIGTCGYHCWDRDGKQCELGYDMYPDYHNHGYMREALSAVLDFAKKNMDLERIVTCIYPENERSVNASLKQGFVLSDETKMYTFRSVDYLHSIYALNLKEIK